MKSRFVTAVILLFVLLCALWWRSTHQDAHAEAILKRPDFAGTSVAYSWVGGYGLVASDVRATFWGTGGASLQIGDKDPVRTKISHARYRELIQSFASNRFDEIKVKRRWGVYLHDIGRYEVVLTDGVRRTVVYADAKHYVAEPELLDPIIETIYSFQAEFGQKLDYGPIAMTGTKDMSEVVVTATVIGCAVVSLVVFVFRRRRKRGCAEQPGLPNIGAPPSKPI